MNYQETIAYLESSLPMFHRTGAAAYKANLDNSEALDMYDGAPHQSYLCVHVGGTNGKGSVSHTLASILQSAGYKVGLCTSPHLIDFRERIRINGEKISEEYVVEYVESHREFFEEIEPSFFEMFVALAFSYFADQGVDIAVIEVGLGGRLDSTNIIQPILSVVTNVSLDHTDLLGNTIEAIAKEKAGIVKLGVPVVVGDARGPVRGVFAATTAAMQTSFSVGSSTWKCLDQHLSEDGKLQHFSFEHAYKNTRIEFDTDLLSAVQSWNLSTVLSAVDQLRAYGCAISEEALKDGLRHVVERTHLLGRWQWLSESPRIVCDTGHNVEGVRCVIAQLNNTPHKKLRIVLGLTGDKDIDGILALLPKDAVYYFTQANVPRALKVGDLMQRALPHELKGQAFATSAEALAAAKQEAEPEDLIFVGGSTYLVGEVMAHLGVAN